MLLLLAACVALALTACRVRTAGRDAREPLSADSGETAGGLSGQGSAPEAVDALPGAAEAAEGGETKENPDAARREFDETAEAEIVPGTEHLLHAPGEGEGLGGQTGAEAPPAVRLNDAAEEPATQTEAAEEAEQMGVSEDAEAADSALTYYSVLLQDRLGSLFECQRLNVYWETEEDHVTVFKTSREHALILGAGAYDVSARLLEENLRVDDGWVARKNPDLIVKVTEPAVLGSGAASTAGAEALRRSLMAREGWSGINAVRSGRVLLLSRELLEAPHLRVMAMLAIAKAANPALFSDVDLDAALRLLTEEAAGAIPSGVFWYGGNLP